MHAFDPGDRAHDDIIPMSMGGLLVQQDHLCRWKSMSNNEDEGRGRCILQTVHITQLDGGGFMGWEDGVDGSQNDGGWVREGMMGFCAHQTGNSIQASAGSGIYLLKSTNWPLSCIVKSDLLR